MDELIIWHLKSLLLLIELVLILMLLFFGKTETSSVRAEVWSDGIYQYQLSPYKALWDVRVQLSLFALLEDCVIPLYCLSAFSLKNKQTVYCSLEKDR